MLRSEVRNGDLEVVSKEKNGNGKPPGVCSGAFVF
jgi:hypothetical protein